jgi:hypothetical protein
MNDKLRRENIPITPPPGVLRASGVAPDVWLSATFAPLWFSDGQREAALDGADARRREIVFAVCFAESYLLEWVRDEALRRQFRDLDKYFRPDARRGVIQKWKDVTTQLESDQVVPVRPDYGQSAAWRDFTKLVGYRDGLVHARASRPKTGDTSEAATPAPTIHVLENMERGWPTGVVIALVTELHAAVGTAPPAWLRNPK